MKKLNTLLIAVLFIFCSSGINAQRYLNEVFTDAQIEQISNVTYGENYSVLGTILDALSGVNPPQLPSAINLRMDIYQPIVAQDTAVRRPLIVYMPTGNFLPPVVNGAPTGSRRDSSAVNIARQMAKRGYVCAVIEYRQGWNPRSPIQLVRTSTILNAAYKGQQDSKAAVRFFRADAATTNTYKIDPDRVVLFGEGTGGYVALAHAYVDKPFKISRLPGLGDNKFLRTENPDSSVVDTSRIGNFDGTNTIPFDLSAFAQTGDFTKVSGNIANNPSYSSAAQFVINMGGALGDPSWLEAGQIPMIGIHAVRDPNAPYQIGDVIVPTTGDIVIPFASGAGYNVTRANELGNNASFATLPFSDPITSIVEARYGQNIGFGGEQIAVGNGKGLLPFILAENPVRMFNHGSPWQFWNSNQPEAMAIVPGSNPPISAHNASKLSNPFMNDDELVGGSNELGRSKALAYIDTVQRYIQPRLVCALGLAQCADVISVKEIPANDIVSVYPNPSNDFVNVTIKPGNGTISSYEMIDVTGKLVKSANRINEYQLFVSRDNLPSGLYLLRIQTAKGFSTQRVIFE
jgi:hypothetical protein